MKSLSRFKFVFPTGLWFQIILEITLSLPFILSGENVSTDQNFQELGKSPLLMHLFHTDEQHTEAMWEKLGHPKTHDEKYRLRGYSSLLFHPCLLNPNTTRAVKALVVIWMISCRFWQLAVTAVCYVNLAGKGPVFRGQMFVICMYWLQRTLGPLPIDSCISL